MQNGMLDVNEEARVCSRWPGPRWRPASSSRRACGNGCLQLNSTPGSRGRDHRGRDERVHVRRRSGNVQWSADAAPRLGPRPRTPGPGPSWLACTRASRPAGLARREHGRRPRPRRTPRSSQNTSTQRADGAQASSIGPAHQVDVAGPGSAANSGGTTWRAEVGDLGG